MSNIVRFTGVTKLAIPVDHVIDGAREAEMTEIVVMGYDKNEELYFASSEPDGPSVLWLLEKCRQSLLNIGEEE